MEQNAEEAELKLSPRFSDDVRMTKAVTCGIAGDYRTFHKRVDLRWICSLPRLQLPWFDQFNPVHFKQNIFIAINRSTYSGCTS